MSGGQKSGKVRETRLAPAPVHVGIIGAGELGTAMAVLAARNCHPVSLYTTKKEIARAINEDHKNPDALGMADVELPPSIIAVSDVGEACKKVSVVFYALPVHTAPDFISANAAALPDDAVFCWTSAGVNLNKRHILAEAMSEAFDRPQPLVVLSGPTCAKQVADAEPTAVIAAARTRYHATTVQKAFSTDTFRVYPSDDAKGKELGAVKEPIASRDLLVERQGFCLGPKLLCKCY